MKRPLLNRPLDLGLVLFFSVSVAYGFLFSLPEGLGVPVSADSPWPPLQWLLAPMLLALRVQVGRDI